MSNEKNPSAALQMETLAMQQLARLHRELPEVNLKKSLDWDL